jgi:hypothetical protein
VNTLIAAILAGVPKALLSIGMVIFSESLMRIVIEKLLIAVLDTAAAYTPNKIDDEIVQTIKQRLSAQNVDNHS